MKFRASAEIYAPADQSADQIRRYVDVVLNDELSRSSLSAISGELQYVPIIMPKEHLGRYPSRSRLKKKQQVYLCAPQLEYSIFVDSDFPDQVREYLRGISVESCRLGGLGLSAEQIKEFEKILEVTFDRVLQEHIRRSIH